MFWSQDWFQMPNFQSEIQVMKAIIGLCTRAVDPCPKQIGKKKTNFKNGSSIFVAVWYLALRINFHQWHSRFGIDVWFPCFCYALLLGDIQMYPPQQDTLIIITPLSGFKPILWAEADLPLWNRFMLTHPSVKNKWIIGSHLCFQTTNRNIPYYIILSLYSLVIW